MTAFGENFITFFYIRYPEQSDVATQLLTSAIVTNASEVKPFAHSAALPRSTYSHLLHFEVLKSTTKLSNLFTFCKTLGDIDNKNNSCYISLAISFLDKYGMSRANLHYNLKMIVL